MEEVEIIKMVPHVVRSLQRRIWIDYDEAADVLYMNFTHLPKVVEHEEDENGIVKNYDEKGNLTGVTIIAAKRFLKAKDEEYYGKRFRLG
ncbi:MAG: DUF2283 domain-containing protein [Euryarchaeota archaeon]|nr:DUF2283 domain-containing protein [Euryarchaeota archaeon]